MHPEARKGLAFLLAFAAVGVLAAVWLRPLLTFTGGPEGQVLDTLKRAEREGFTLAVAPGLKARRAHFDRIAVVLEKDASAVAHATLDFDGELGRTEVSSLGVERVPFRPGEDGLQPAAGLAPLLAAVVAQLEARRAALEAADAERLAHLTGGVLTPADVAAKPGFQAVAALTQRSYRAQSWHVRIERDGAVVTERYRLSGVLPDRPVDSRAERTLSLVRRGEGFFFSGELM